MTEGSGICRRKRTKGVKKGEKGGGYIIHIIHTPTCVSPVVSVYSVRRSSVPKRAGYSTAETHFSIVVLLVLVGPRRAVEGSIRGGVGGDGWSLLDAEVPIVGAFRF